MTNTIFFKLLRDYDSVSSSSLGSSCATSVQGEAELSNVEALSLYSYIGKTLFACTRPSPELLTDDTSSIFEEVETDQQQIHGIDAGAAKLKRFSLDELRSATQRFNAANLLGEGLYGRLYKGWVHHQNLTATEPGKGLAVAVKRLNNQDYCDQDWLDEIDHVRHLDHPNLVKLVGYCLEDHNRLLVYQFMPQGSLQDQLFRRYNDLKEPLSWSLRMKVALDAAKGLAFLHNARPQVIHGNFKPSNILLDLNNNARLSGFGLAKANPCKVELETVCGPMEFDHAFLSEYSAPEAFHTGDLTSQSDVYSFGVVLMEMLLDPTVVRYHKGTSVNFLYAVRAMRCLYNSHVRLNIDSRLHGQYSVKAVKKVALLASQCLTLKVRPTMDDVVAILETIQ